MLNHRPCHCLQRLYLARCDCLILADPRGGFARRWRRSKRGFVIWHCLHRGPPLLYAAHIGLRSFEESPERNQQAALL